MLGPRQWTLAPWRGNLNTDLLTHQLEIVRHRGAEIERDSIGMIDHDSNRAAAGALNGEHFQSWLGFSKLGFDLGVYLGRIHLNKGIKKVG